ncbi:M15 family metallopeptidase [Dokdonella sp.]|uniref:M15 family metallopeptidase n=1 Tax=Dokdonella sp. TaxID=2291710 RepID=UPI0025BCB816|nr:M15 family metallopeptidase [Dokdonella sp.]
MIDAPLPTRCDVDARAEVIARARQLGVPTDHARRHKLRLVREPNQLASIGFDIHGREQWLMPRAALAFARMRAAAHEKAIELQVVSAFRSAHYQLGIIERKLARGQPIEDILRVSAAPGYSEHHSGRALDLTTPGFSALEEEFAQSLAFKWLHRHAACFGFVMSYPRGNHHGIAYEPWHWCWHARAPSARR